MLNRIAFVFHFILLIGVWADDFNCPKEHISINSGTTGSLPAGATSMVKLPAKTNCTYMFDIPKGFALRMETSAVYDVSPGDFVRFDYFFISSGADKDVEYAIQSPLPYQVYSVTGNLTFFATYSYVDLSSFKQKIFPTGTFFNTTTEPNTYYTFKASQTTETVGFKLSMLDTGFFDYTDYELFVFDGNDFMNSEYLGRLSELLKYFNFHSTKDTLTFLNLYRDSSYSYVFGNDYSKIQNLDQYTAGVFNVTGEKTGYMYNVEGHDDAYYTFFCDGCTSFYIESLTFDTSYSNDTNGYLEVQGMSPTQGLSPILNYTFSPFTNMSLPQLIPTNMATFHTHKCRIIYSFRTDGQSGWLSTGDNEKRSVYSPKLWNTNAEQSFDYTFSDPLKVYNFSINLESIGLVNDGDELDVTVGSVNGLTTLDKKYTKTSMARVPISGMGRYLHLKYTGSKDSEVILNFKMIDQTTPPMESTTVGTTGTGSTVSTSTGPTTPSTLSTSLPTSKQVSTNTTSPIVITSTQSTTIPSRTFTSTPVVTSSSSVGSSSTRVITTSSSTPTPSTTTVIPPLTSTVTTNPSTTTITSKDPTSTISSTMTSTSLNPSVTTSANETKPSTSTPVVTSSSSIGSSSTRVITQSSSTSSTPTPSTTTVTTLVMTSTIPTSTIIPSTSTATSTASTSTSTIIPFTSTERKPTSTITTTPSTTTINSTMTSKSWTKPSTSTISSSTTSLKATSQKRTTPLLTTSTLTTPTPLLTKTVTSTTGQTVTSKITQSSTTPEAASTVTPGDHPVDPSLQSSTLSSSPSTIPSVQSTRFISTKTVQTDKTSASRMTTSTLQTTTSSTSSVFSTTGLLLLLIIVIF